ncbi:toxin-antitoxin system YwqK family antitoxin [Pseudomonas hormoni]|uniref:Toxin-antitoxin system YwqK family antitoxin n=1 Tax=Pseudomonas hormoni TaxID=3093767 RepID=A0ABX8EXT9_9PSED|nr:toxin-antitoxin system YwqK family antitoxin [Pseudomonas hormoni]QVW24564.1 toxin-antitoxin system YwqK family antitoxin [Pseudomonas hormoni]
MQFIPWKTFSTALVILTQALPAHAETSTDHPTVIVDMNPRATYLAKGAEVNGHAPIQLRAAALLTLSTPHACGSNEVYMTPESAGIPIDSFRRALDEVQQLIDQKIPLLLTHSVCERKRAFLEKVRPCTPEECGELMATLIDGKQYLDRDFSPIGQGQASYYLKMPMDYDSKRKAWAAQIFYVETQTPSHEYFVDAEDFVSGKPVDAYRSYYRSGKLRRSYQHDANGLRQGQALTYSENLTVIKRDNYLNNEPEGWQTVYHDNGKISESYNWHQGKRVDGEYLEYDEAGALIGRISYQNDVLHGPILGYYPDGRIKHRGQYVEGKMVGPNTHYHPDGSLEHSGEYVDSKPLGWHTQYHPNGKVRQKVFNDEQNVQRSYATWNDQGIQTVQWQWDEQGREQGDFKEWHKNGQLKEQKTYKDGKLEGALRTWYDDGQMNTSVEYKDNLTQGPGRFWAQDGSLTLECQYEAGERRGECVRMK